MAFVPGGRFLMGSDHFYPEEAPVRRVAVDGFFMDRFPVSNRAFARFVDATGYLTLAERPPDPRLYPGLEAAALRAGSIVFTPPAAEVAAGHPSWWRYVPDACWHRPDGIAGLGTDRLDHPVVHVAFEDALAYADWAGKALPREAEWEFAARGGLDGAAYAWGDIFEPDGLRMANTWPGPFPWRGADGPHRYGTSAVGSFPANGYGLADMIGNVWEWTADFWTPRHAAAPAGCCAVAPAAEPRGDDRERSFDPAQPGIRIPRRVLKGGSHLCAPNYCRRYRPAARHPEMEDSATTHIGFRCILRP
ncbi:formylglycine-generating enzyme family protein [Lichenihabitans sp. Uapishka_5]|uniref:formylglycine-generating enzyme family protein n=1 Tax=Lichenihabitans sp. Uapishka_5 TaxID=3037302 RepID=UPI0029E7DA71|nr:formylglycine-generating enzyme family protein [Lichenihabitans sp. Uapishka_5]MDX7953445.1 formylglycine-generating enzyme family protein [Lichenihabitans sp. Uapishka_5]